MELNSVSSITKTSDPTAFLVVCTYTDDNGVTSSNAQHIYRESDPYGQLTPLIKQFLIDNPDYPIADYAPPTIQQLREGAPPLERLFFFQRAKEAGLTSAVRTDYITSISDPSAREDAQIYWDNVQWIGRFDQHVVAAAEYAGLTEEQLDAIYYITPPSPVTG